MLRLALIHGCQQAAGQYAQAQQRLRGLQITAAVSPDDDKRREITQALGISCQAATWGELLNRHGDAFDAVLIRGPVRLRADLACQAAAAGKHVCLTSPAAASASELARITAACTKAGVTLMTCPRSRFEPTVAAVKSALDSGKLGSPALLRSHQWLPQKSLGSDRANSPNPSTGPVWAELVNQLELALWMIGTTPSVLYAQGCAGQAEPAGWPDYLQVQLGFPTEAMALLSLGVTLPPGDQYQTLSVIGATGAAYADDHAQRQLLLRGDQARALLGSQDVPTRTAQLRTFLQGVSQRPTQIGVREAEAALRIADAARISFAERRPVSLTE